MRAEERLRVAVVQLPFPAIADPHPALLAYYRSYAQRYAEEVPGYFIPEGELWELPLWAGHVSGLVAAEGHEVAFLDLSTAQPTAAASTRAILDATRAGDVVMLSPLAQNFDIARAVSRTLVEAGRRTVIGGNMAPLATAADATVVHRGLLDQGVVARMLARMEGVSVREARLGRAADRIAYVPDYSIFGDAPRRVPLVRLNASHGCLFACNFCGDAWSRQLHVVDRLALEREVDELARRFPDCRLVYVGDKTFGQSPKAVENLIAVFSERPGYSFVVQTHVLQVTPRLIEQMDALGVRVVELGLETADHRLLRDSHKASKGLEAYAARIEQLTASGRRVVLNVLGSLPHERPESHQLTVDFIRDRSTGVWLYNLYNFVPYPLTPIFAELRERIFNWTFADWREDAPPVFHPYHQSWQRSWEAFLEKVEAAHAAIDAPLGAPA